MDSGVWNKELDGEKALAALCKIALVLFVCDSVLDDGASIVSLIKPMILVNQSISLSRKISYFHFFVESQITMEDGWAHLWGYTIVLCILRHEGLDLIIIAEVRFSVMRIDNRDDKALIIICFKPSSDISELSLSKG